MGKLVISTVLILSILIAVKSVYTHFLIPCGGIKEYATFYNFAGDLFKILIGIGLTVVLNRISTTFKKTWVLLSWSVVLSVLVLAKAIQEIPKGIENYQMSCSICSKIETEGLQVNAYSLSGREYNYLAMRSNMLPHLPKETKAVNIFYYNESFLGEYSLTVKAKLPLDRENAALNSDWEIIGTDSINRLQVIKFQDARY